MLWIYAIRLFRANLLQWANGMFYHAFSFFMLYAISLCVKPLIRSTILLHLRLDHPLKSYKLVGSWKRIFSFIRLSSFCHKSQTFRCRCQTHVLSLRVSWKNIKKLSDFRDTFDITNIFLRKIIFYNLIWACIQHIIKQPNFQEINFWQEKLKNVVEN